jgi:hypothetical protein
MAQGPGRQRGFRLAHVVGLQIHVNAMSASSASGTSPIDSPGQLSESLVVGLPTVRLRVVGDETRTDDAPWRSRFDPS